MCCVQWSLSLVAGVTFSLSELTTMDGEVVLVTGGSGFLGQHVVRELQRDSRVTEVRVLDLRPHVNRLGHEIKKPIVSICADIKDLEACRTAFTDVSCVFHCAAKVSYECPAPEDMWDVNVLGTQNVLKLCVEMNVPRLVFTSTSEVTLTPYFRHGFFCAVINQTEAKAKPPKDLSTLVFAEYAGSKLQAERMVCEANGTHLKSGGQLRTVALRPTVLYGEEDRGLIPQLMKLADMCDLTFPRISGPGGKHQLCYAGNAAWAHICAKDTLQDRPEAVGGLPVFVTDDSPITDITKFCIRLTQTTGEPSLYHHSWWYLPAPVSYLLAVMAELVLTRALPSLGCGALPLSPSAAITFLGSVMLYNRLRADTHLRYSPVYTLDKVRKSLVNYYTEEVMASCKKIQ